MTETSVLAELMFEVVPHWNGRLGKYIKEVEGSQKADSGIIITPPGMPAPKIVGQDGGSSTRRITPGIVTTPGVGGAPMPPPSPITLPQATPVTDPSDKPDDSQPKRNLASPLGQCHLSSKPDPKARFSSLTSPVVMYDGESQQMLCDMWTALNNKRGGLRKEMMAVKRRQQLASVPPPPPPPPPRVMPEIAMDSDGDGSDKEDEDVEHSAEMLRLRLKMEREKMKRMIRRGPPGVGPAPAPDMGPPPVAMGGLQFKRARMMGGAAGIPLAQPTPSSTSANDEKMEKLLEGVDENLDKACKVTETVAFLWLKGDAYEGHLKFIMGRLNDIVDKIEKSSLVPPKKKETEERKDVVVTVMASPPPPSSSPLLQKPQQISPSPRLEVSKKKSDLTMRDAPSLRMVNQVQVHQPASTPLLPPISQQPPIEAKLERKKSTGSNTSEDTVGPSMESANPPLVLVSTTSTGTAAHVDEDVGKVVVTVENNNPLKLKHEVLEVVKVHRAEDDDDEGIVC